MALEEQGWSIVTLRGIKQVSKRLKGTACFRRTESSAERIRHKVGSDPAVSTEVLYKRAQEPNSRWRVCEEWIALLEDKLEFGGGYSVHRVTSVSHQSNTITKPKYSNHICIITVPMRQPIREREREEAP